MARLQMDRSETAVIAGDHITQSVDNRVYSPSWQSVPVDKVTPTGHPVRNTGVIGAHTGLQRDHHHPHGPPWGWYAPGQGHGAKSVVTWMPAQGPV